MGMSSHVEGFRPPDEQWAKMKDAYDACVKAGVPVPPDVLKFFSWQAPDSAGVRVELGNEYERHESVERFAEDGRDGFTVDIAKLPDSITHVRFINSY